MITKSLSYLFTEFAILIVAKATNCEAFSLIIKLKEKLNAGFS